MMSSTVHRKVIVPDNVKQVLELYKARMKKNENSLSISGRIITDTEFIIELPTKLKTTPKKEKLCNLERYFEKTYSTIVQQ